MFSNKKLVFYIAVATISMTQAMFGMEKEIPLTHRIIVGQMSQEDPSRLGQKSPSDVFWTQGFPTNQSILSTASMQGEEKLISGHMEQLGLYERTTTITERVTEKRSEYCPALIHTNREVFDSSTHGSLTSGQGQEYAQWIYNTYQQWIFTLAQQRIAEQEKKARQRDIEWQEREERHRQWQEEEKREKEEYREKFRREIALRDMYKSSKPKHVDPTYAREKSNYDYAKKQHDHKCLGNKILDELYFVQNNTWAQVCEKNNKVYKTRRTPEQIKIQDSFNQKEPINPNDRYRTLSYDRHQWKYELERIKNPKAPKAPKIRKKELKFAYVDFDKIYEYVEIDLVEKLNFVIQEFSTCNYNQINHIDNCMFTDNSILDLNNKQFDLKNLPKEMLLNELQILKNNLLARRQQDITDAHNELHNVKEKVNKENARIQANHEAFLEQLETEAENYRFECGCQKVMRNIMQYNEAELIKAFLHIRSSKTTFESLSPLKDGKDITSFSTIKQHAFKNYFPECNSLKILREHANLLAMIKYAPCYVQVICEPDQLPVIKPIDTFSNKEDSHKFIAWYQTLKDKPWDVDSTNYIEKFIKAYCNESDSFFDSFKYLITNTLFSYEQLDTLVKESNNELARKIQSHLSKSRNKLHNKQQNMNCAHVFTKDYELFYSKSQHSDLAAFWDRKHKNNTNSYSSETARNNFCIYPTNQQLKLVSQQKFETDGSIEYEQCDSIGLPKELHILKYPYEKKPLGEETKVLWDSFIEFVKAKVGDKKDKIIGSIRQQVTNQRDHLIEPQQAAMSESVFNEDNTTTSSSTTKQALQWTHHGYKHVAPKNIPWKKLIKGTTHGDALYKPETNIKELEWLAWKHGKKTTNGKNWKVFKFDSIIGANSGKETSCVRIECSANTIHGHPISESNYMELLK